ncbi:MAG: hypothetical protein ACYCWE_00235 [Eubacteriales bacterium]
MKKLLLIILSLIILLSVAACRADEIKNPEETDENTQSENTQVEETEENTQAEVTTENPSDSEDGLEGILEKIYETAAVSAGFKDYIATGLQTTPITAENCEYQLGKAGIEFESAIASEPMMSASAYSLCLVRVKESADIEAVKNEIKENVDPQKWICVGVDPNNIIVDNVGDVIILIMSDNEGTALHDAFLALK